MKVSKYPQTYQGLEFTLLYMELGVLDDMYFFLCTKKIANGNRQIHFFFDLDNS